LKTVSKALESSPKYVEPEQERVVQSNASSMATPKQVAVEPVNTTVEGDYISGIAKTYFDLPLREARDLFEKAYFEHQMQIMGGSMTKISEYTGLERTHLYRKLKALGIDTSRNKGES
jgi:DNA-binding NtrC family response regulator